MKVIFTCGGTAGHVNPALALAGYMREKDASTQILFVGAERGLERDLIAHTDYPFRTVNISSFHRSFRPAEIKHNLVSLKNLAHAEREANAILNDFHPDIIVGTMRAIRSCATAQRRASRRRCTSQTLCRA